MRLQKFLAFALAFVAPLAVHAQNIITTVVGGGPANVPGTSASIGNPTAVAKDASGNTYIFDAWSYRVFKVDAAGKVSVYAGNGFNGYSGDGGLATNAQVSWGYGLAVDTSGNLFIADTANNVIREVVATTGIIQTVASNGTYGYGGDGGAATSATLSSPYGIFVDASGNLFIADSGNNVIREVVAATDIIQTVAGNGTYGYGGDGGAATSATLSYPNGIFVDAAGNLFIADSSNNVIREVVAATDIIQTVAGNGAYGYGGDGGAATSATLSYPYGIFVDASGNLFIADFGNNVIREVVATTGFIQTVAGNNFYSYGGDGAAATGAQLNSPAAIASDAAGNLFIVDQYNNVIREVVATTGIIQTVAGNGTYGYGGDGGAATSATLDYPYGVSIDASGNLFVADTNNCVIREVVAATGLIQTVAGTPQSCNYSGDGGAATSATLSYPYGIFVDASGNLFIADSGNNVIREVVAATGIIQTVAGNYNLGPAYSGDGGAATSATLSSPYGIFVDASGNLFIADSSNSVIREVVAATGIIQTVAGNYNLGSAYSGDGGAATSATLSSPYGIFVDASGNLFIADLYNTVIREVAGTTANGMTAGYIYTVTGNGNWGYSGDGGDATVAELNYPQGLTFGPSGSLLIADSGNNVIRSVAGLLGEPWLSLSTNGLTFAAQAEGTTATQTATLTNTGTTSLTVNSIVISGNNSADFAEADTCTGVTLAANASCTVTITYAPSVIGAEAATLTIVDTANSPRTVTLNGTGVLVTATLGSTSLAFGNQLVATASAAQSVPLTNGGNRPLTIASIAVTGTNTGDFAETDNCGSSVAAGASCTINVTFTPGAAGSRTAAISITDNAPASPQTISLSGTGLAPSPTVGFSPASLTFSTTYVGVAATAQTVTLTNSGAGALNVSSIAITGTNSSEFAQSNTCGSSVAAGASCTINVTFTPGAAGSRTAAISITDNAPASPQTISLSGTGLAPSPTVGFSPASLTFSTTYVGVAATAQTVTLTNSGAGALNVSSIAVTGTNSSEFAQSNTCGTSVAAGASCTINVKFMPGAAGSRTAAITITDNATGSPQIVTLSGAGISASLSMASNSSATTVKAGQTATYSLQLTATGGASTDQVSATISCSGAPALSSCSSSPSTVTATPATPGTFTVKVTTTGSGMLVPSAPTMPKTLPPAVLRTLPLTLLALLLSIAAMLAWAQSPAARQRTVRVALSACLVLLPVSSAMLLMGCASGSSSPGSSTTSSTPTGTYTITVTATVSGQTQTTTLTLVVQ